MALMDWRDRHGQAFAGRGVLVTGGAGFIGSHLAQALAELGARVVVIDDLSGGDAENLDSCRGPGGEAPRFIEGSILDREALAQVMAGCSLVYHQAALGSVPRSVAEPERFHAANATGTLNVLQAAREAGVRRVVFAASSSAYGDSQTLPKVETMAVLPKSPYAATKVAGEALMRAWAGSYGPGLDTCSLRYFNIFGPRQNANSAYAAVIAAFAKSLGEGGRPVIFGDGEQSRDFTFVDNAVEANLLAGRAEGRIGGEVFNVACGARVTVEALAGSMASLMGRPGVTPEHRAERAGDVRHSLADLSRIADRLGYEPVVGFEDGLAATVRWYQSKAEEASGKVES